MTFPSIDADAVTIVGPETVLRDRVEQRYCTTTPSRLASLKLHWVFKILQSSRAYSSKLYAQGQVGIFQSFDTYRDLIFELFFLLHQAVQTVNF